MTLHLATKPGFTDVPDANLAAGKPASSFVLSQISQNAAFGAVRLEFFSGVYVDGDTVPLPKSPIDGYQYSRNELMYAWGIYSTFNKDTHWITGPDCLAYAGWKVDQETGQVFSTEYYRRSSNANPNWNQSHDGKLQVCTIAQRLLPNITFPPPSNPGVFYENGWAGVNLPSISVTSESRLLVIISFYADSGAGIVSLSDGQGTSYSSIYSSVQDGSYSTFVYLLDDPIVLDTPLTFSVSTSGVNKGFVNVTLAAISDLADGNPVDQVAIARGTSGEPDSGATAGTSEPNELIIGYAINKGVSGVNVIGKNDASGIDSGFDIYTFGAFAGLESSAAEMRLQSSSGQTGRATMKTQNGGAENARWMSFAMTLKTLLGNGSGDVPTSFQVIEDAEFYQDRPLNESLITTISRNAKYSCFNSEVIYMGEFIDGDTVPKPVSPVDGFEYDYSQVFFMHSWRWTTYENNFVQPALNLGQLDRFNAHVDSDGTVSVFVEYYPAHGGVPSHADGHGRIAVFAFCSRTVIEEAS